MGHDPLSADPVVQGDGGQVPDHLVLLGGQNPAVHLVRERVGPEPAPHQGVPACLVGLRVVGVDQGRSLSVPRSSSALSSGRTAILVARAVITLRFRSSLLVGLVPGSAGSARGQETECK